MCARSARRQEKKALAQAEQAQAQEDEHTASILHGRSVLPGTVVLVLCATKIYLVLDAAKLPLRRSWGVSKALGKECDTVSYRLSINRRPIRHTM